MSARSLQRSIAALVIGAVLTAACSTADDDDSVSADNTTGGGEPTASSELGTGVTADTIKIGFSYIDLETLAKSGVIKIDHGPYDQMIKVLVDDVNAHGGVNGRKLELSTAKYSPIGNTEQLAACTKLTEDDKVFAVLNGLLQDNNLCIVQQHATILVGGNLNSVLLAKARAPWATGAASDDRAIKALVKLMDENDYLKGHTVAVYAQGTVNQPLIDLAVKTLKDAGYEAVDTAVFDVPAGDTQAAAAQDKVIAERFKDKGVDTVINVGLFTPGVDWDNAGFHPAMFQSNAGNIAAAAFTNPLEKFPIVAGVADSADPNAGFNSPEMRRCREVWKRATGKEILTGEEENKLGHSTGSGAMGAACGTMQIFVAAAKAAGPNLTQETWEKGLESLGTISKPPAPVMSFGPGKPDGQDSFQLVKHDPNWKPDSSEPQFIPIGEAITQTK
jgi:ABC-type branched-subunit amino acid transport system substrate-binding protein